MQFLFIFHVSQFGIIQEKSVKMSCIPIDPLHVGGTDMKGNDKKSAAYSQLNGKLCSIELKTSTSPRMTPIHQDARFFLIKEGTGKFMVQNTAYPLRPHTLISVLPWQISDMVQVDSPIRYVLVTYNYDAITQAVKIFSNLEGQTESFLTAMENHPVVYLEPEDRTVDFLTESLSRELESEISLPFHNVNLTSLLVQLAVHFIRLTRRQASESRKSKNDYTEILRYIYLHCNEKLTLDKLSSLFHCSPSVISTYLNQITGLSFSALLSEIRIGKTLNFIMYTDFTLKEMSEFLGYVDESHISKVFAARIGSKISDYKKVYQKVQNICRIEESRTVYTVINYIYRNYAEDLNAKDTAHKFGISVPRLNELLLYQVEQNFSEFLNQVRVNRASELLLIPHKTVLEIAYEVGYKSPKTFSRNFLKLKGMPPNTFKQKYSVAL